MNSSSLHQWIDDLAAEGRISFTAEEAARVHGGEEAAVQGVLRRLRQRREIATPLRGYHLILPPEYRRLGCLPPLWFIDDLAATMKIPYYVSLLSAAELHGAAHQRPQTFQVMLSRPHRPIFCEQVHIDFSMRTNLGQLPVMVRNTPKGTVRIATPEVTALDLVGYPHRVGGLDHVAGVLAELAEVLQPKSLLQVAPLSPIAWSQRLGFLLDLLKFYPTDDLAAYVAEAPLCALDVEQPFTRTTCDPRWRVFVNIEIEP
ncbi:MAG TPA: type IV toxin-antitoxin system AbiEi family antitoxin [Myxococcota bacterium]|nr:type IV toxin-antitoxin system AbiEi family antitoxin [Myxococcota bacterium]HNH45720.1 type IV toxin-antitoxin system AbiEi family antitoxin [Myxococcota bacterium]